MTTILPQKTWIPPTCKMRIKTLTKVRERRKARRVKKLLKKMIRRGKRE